MVSSRFFIFSRVHFLIFLQVISKMKMMPGMSVCSPVFSVGASSEPALTKKGSVFEMSSINRGCYGQACFFVICAGFAVFLT